jgi:hypothetical protein
VRATSATLNSKQLIFSMLKAGPLCASTPRTNAKAGKAASRLRREIPDIALVFMVVMVS